MKLRTKDQIHISSVGPNTMGKGTEFEVSDAAGKELLKANPNALEMVGSAAPVEDDHPAARRGRDPEDQAQGKAEPAHADKAEKPPLNKMAESKRSPRHG